MKTLSFLLYSSLLACATGFQRPAKNELCSRSSSMLNLFGEKEKVEEAKIAEIPKRFLSFGQSNVESTVGTKANAFGMPFFKTTSKVEQAVVMEEDSSWTDFGKTPITYAYAALWVGLVGFTFFFAPGELNSASDSAMIQSIIENPTAPEMNSFYYGIFNLFAIIPIVLACTIAPRASDKGIPSGPPLFLSAFIAYFVMGPYLALRKQPESVVNEIGWVTRNIWENKLVNYATVAFGILCLAAGAPGLEDPASSWQGMLDLLQTSRFASVSFADLSLITLILTKEVTDDYKIRCEPENEDKAGLIGASTALLPLLGAAIYCAARPSLPKEE